MKKTAPQGEALLVFMTVFILGLVNHPSAQTLPSPWKHSDIGSPSAAGRASVASGTFTIAGAGRIDAGADEFHFVYQQISGDVDLRVRVNSLQDVDPWAKAGVMIRDGLGAGVRHAFMSVSAGRGLNFDRRRAADGDTQHTDGGDGAAPVWVRLVRTGNDFAAYKSSTGTSWTLVGRETISMRATAYVGLAVASDQASRTASATFSSVTLQASAGLPEPWLTTDIGDIEPGDATVSSGAITMTGAGAGISGTSDQFHYAYQLASGDVEIIVKLTALGGTDGQANAGVMIRQALTPTAAHATMLGTAFSGWEFQRRLIAKDKTFRSAGPAGRAPGWVRIVREGNLFTAYQSSDGARWTLVGSDRITMPGTAYVGLAVSSDNPVTLATASFASVLIRKPVVVNDPPEVSILSPSSGDRFPAGASIAIKASATDPDGVVAGVDFYRGSTLLGSDKTSPFGATWASATAGTHTLSAVARDSDGATTAASITIIVGSAPPKKAMLMFVPSVDHDKKVSSYTLAIYRATDLLTVTPLKKSDLGKPSPVDGEIAVDISAILGTLASGTYKVVVTATGPGGSASSTPSPSFVK